MHNLVILIGLFIFFFFINPFIISKIWSNKYTNFNFFETYLISFAVLIFIMFLSFTPVYVIYSNIKSSNTEGFAYLKYILFVIQAILLIIYFLNWKKATINVSFDYRKIIIFSVIFFLFLLTWFLYVKFTSPKIDYSFLTIRTSIFSFVFLIIQDIAYAGNIVPAKDYIWFTTNIFYPLILFLISFACSSMFNYFKLKTFRNVKYFVFSIIALFMFLIYFQSKIYWSNYANMGFAWIFPLLILLYSITIKTNNEITTNSDLSAVINIIILALPFFNKQNYIISLFIFATFIFYMYIMKFENSALESLKMLSYVFLSFSLANLTSQESKLIIYAVVFLVLSIVLLITINSFNKTYRFYDNIRKIDNFIANKISIIIGSIFVAIVLVSFFIIANKNFSVYLSFFEINGNFSTSYTIMVGVVWFLSLLVFIVSATLIKKGKRLNSPIIIISLFVIMIYNPFSKDIIDYILKTQIETSPYYALASTMLILPLLMSIASRKTFVLSFKDNQDKKNKIIEIMVKIVSLTILLMALSIEVLLFYGAISGISI